jgi:NAD(P)H-dependent flavin oxidoreductase YrpB (nitropropane dioxygenase family)
MIFRSKYPLLAAAMNQVSDVNLAVACHDAGIQPSISLLNYLDMDNKDFNFVKFERDLKEYQDRTGSNQCLLSTIPALFVNERIQSMMSDLDMLDIELINADTDRTYNDDIKSLKEKFKSQDPRIFIKKNKIGSNTDFICDGVILKGSKGAGTVGTHGLSLTDLFFQMKNTLPGVPLIVSGGIGTSIEVSRYLKFGAAAIGIGTLLAASEESCLSLESKMKMVESNFMDVKKFLDSNQNALIFNHVEDDDRNHTKSLQAGIADYKKGHLFVGRGINYIKSIRPVKDIVEDLVKNL